MSPTRFFLLRRLLPAALLLPGAVLAQSSTLTVSAAASLTDALRALAPPFEAAHPGATLRYNFAASGVLIQQIAQGAPVDVFISADAETMERGIAQKLLDPASRREFAANQVVLVMPAAAGAPPRMLADLGQPGFQRIAIGKPATVPVGRYARQALERAGLWATLQPRLIPADSVRQVLDYVARGEVDAGFVYRTDAALMADKVRVVLSAEGHAPVRYPAAVVADSAHPALARAFVDYLSSPPAQAVLARYGFARP